jgi:signal transduction histidine kinase
MKPELIAMWNDGSVPAPVRSRLGTDQEKGAGFGLMLSKTFALVMGGRLSVKSEVGAGSDFSLVLPRSRPV